MGLGPPVLALYRQLKILGAFDNVRSVVEMGSQGVWCPQRELLTGLLEAFDKPIPSDNELAIYINNTGTGHAPSRDLHQRLGFQYECVDIDGNFGSITLDMNFDPVPEKYIGKFDLTTNHGTTEHIFNQFNAFKMIHDFTAKGGLMLHALPFTVHLEHGFFNYQPNVFDALARYNSYKTLGVWVGPDWQLSSFVPWQPQLLDYLTLSSKTTHLLVVLQQKMFDTDFCVPIQNHYEPMVPDAALSRYQLVIDGEYYSGTRFRHLSKQAMQNGAQIETARTRGLAEYPGREIAKEFGRRVGRRAKRLLGR
jgi:hypothetical protein